MASGVLFLEDTHHKAIWNCPFCGNEYTASINHRTSGGTECPTCAKASKGERKVKAVLDELGVTYGIYSQSISREEDIENSKRFEAVYDRLLCCANDVPVIVLTHTPMRDWSKQQYNGNWIYISGHTHKNVMSIKKSGAIVLENNQFGYCGKFCRFKKFVLNHAVYDPLCDLEDGIHEISKLQYLDFMYIRKIPIPEMKRTGKFWAIKK